METGENNPTLIKTHDFDLALSKQYHLSLQIGINNFAFCILDTENITYQYLESHNFITNSTEEFTKKLTGLIDNSEVLKSIFSSLSITFSGFPNTLIPNNIYKEEDKKKMLELNNHVFEKIFTNNINIHEIKLIYSVPESILTIINAFFPEAKCKAEETILINQYSKLENINVTAYINITNKRMLVTILNKEKLIFNNVFDFVTKEDVLYYILFCFEQLNLSAETTQVIIFGEISKNDETYNLMYKYIRHIKFGERAKEFNFPIKFDSIHQHQYFGLLSQVLCV